MNQLFFICYISSSNLKLKDSIFKCRMSPVLAGSSNLFAKSNLQNRPKIYNHNFRADRGHLNVLTLLKFHSSFRWRERNHLNAGNYTDSPNYSVISKQTECPIYNRKFCERGRFAVEIKSYWHAIDDCLQSWFKQRVSISVRVYFDFLTYKLTYHARYVFK